MSTPPSNRRSGPRSEGRPKVPREDMILLLQRDFEIGEVLAFANGAPAPAEDGPAAWLLNLKSQIKDESPRDIAKRWATLFRDEIETVRRVRGSVVHHIDIDPASVKTALTIAERLLAAIGHPSVAANS